MAVAFVFAAAAFQAGVFLFLWFSPSLLLCRLLRIRSYSRNGFLFQTSRIMMPPRRGAASRMPFPHKNIRLHSAKYVGQSTYFVTLCCARRHPAFANPKKAAELVVKLREQSIAQRFEVHAYCVMPDHFHGLFAGLDLASDLLVFVKNLKQITTHGYQNSSHGTLWQKKFYDHILRERDNAAGVAGYIWMNPVRKGLCNDPRTIPGRVRSRPNGLKQFHLRNLGRPIGNQRRPPKKVAATKPIANAEAKSPAGQTRRANYLPLSLRNSIVSGS